MKCLVLLTVGLLAAATAQRAASAEYYLGADLSYVNEIEECGAVYRAGDVRRDPFELLHSRGANLVRVRLWNDAQWTRYSNLADVKKTIARARKAGMQVLLDYHYSDDWADGDKQIIPRAWAHIEDPDALAAALYEFTLRTLRELDAAGLMPELVQVGNETNGAILSTLARAKDPIDWTRNAKLLNAGIKAVRDAGAQSSIRPRVMLHIAQPENVEPWFAAATAAGVTDFDLIGISYYRRWSTQGLEGLGAAINRLRHRYPADVLLVEAAYPWTLDHADTMPNLLGTDTLIQDYPATPQGQRRYLIDLTQLVIANGGVGMVYWEPAWISSSCKTRWGVGSSWENAALFDFDGRLLPGADYLDYPYVHPVALELSVNSVVLRNVPVLYLWGDFLGADAPAIRLDVRDNQAKFVTRLMPATPIRFQLYRDPQRREPILHSDDIGGLVRGVVGAGATAIDLSSRVKTCDRCPTQPAPDAVGTFNIDWRFHRFDTMPAQVNLEAVAPADWEPVTLPHTARLEPRIVNDQWQGLAVYRKQFNALEAWRGKQIRLRFEGAMNVARVSLNGRELSTHLGGYLPFVVDLSDAIRFDAQNDLVVWLDNRDNAITGPKPLRLLDFNMYGGLYRDATLTISEPVHISDEIMAAIPGGGGIFVTYPQVATDRAVVAVKTHVRNVAAEPADVRITQTLWQGDRVVAQGTSAPATLGGQAATHVNVQLAVDRPQLWSPQSPSLYSLVTTVQTAGRIADRRLTIIGIRRIEFVGGQVRINGAAQFLRGVNRHQEYPYVGYALSPAADYRDAKRIKEAGFDLVRLSHYPQSPHFMAAADELGLVLLDSIPGWQFFNTDPAFASQVLQTCRDMIRRDRNHPSVIAWECSLNETQMPAELVRQLDGIVHEEYPGDQAYSAGWQNDGYDIYIQARQHRLEHYATPDRPYLVSEYGDWEYYALNAGFQQHTWANLQADERTSRQLLSSGERRLLQQATNNQEAHNDNFATPAFADAYWVMFDYNRGYAEDLEASGAMSLERLPKFNYQFFRSQRDPRELSPLFSAGPFVYIASYWQPDSTTLVRVFGNVDEVELRLNGRPVARQRPDTDRMSQRLRHPPFTFNVRSFAAGTLEAVGYLDGRAVAQHRVVTPESAERIVLTVDAAGVCAQEGDLLFGRARLVDRNGTTVPRSGREVAFVASGGLQIVGPARQLTAEGIASVLLRSDSQGRTARLVATSGVLSNQQSIAAGSFCSEND